MDAVWDKVYAPTAQWSTFLLFCLLLFDHRVGATFSPAWWSSVAQLSAHYPTEPLTDPETFPTRVLCTQLPGMSPGQARVCESFADHMPAVGRGARQAIEVCQHLFQNRRWNCSTPYGSGVFGPVHSIGTREAAFTFAIVAAGVAHEVSKGCRNGHLQTCGCGVDQRPDHLNPEWMWGGCGDNMDYGHEFSQNFIDIREREQNFPKESADYARSLMNRWNNEVGRKLIKRKSKVTCKCHGVSGSCNLKTCWKSLAPLDEIGEHLLDKYEEAVRIRINKRGNMQVVRRNRQKRAQKQELVYLDDSPDYCRPDEHSGALGTQGRVCTLGSHSLDSCSTLCCGRGYQTTKKTVSEKCNCKFQWCCKVVCSMCSNSIVQYVCN